MFWFHTWVLDHCAPHYVLDITKIFYILLWYHPESNFPWSTSHFSFPKILTLPRITLLVLLLLMLFLILTLLPSGSQVQDSLFKSIPSFLVAPLSLLWQFLALMSIIELFCVNIGFHSVYLTFLCIPPRKEPCLNLLEIFHR